MRAARAVAAPWLACALWLIGGCGDEDTSSSLERNEVDGGGAQLQALWRYRSSEVDVDIRLVTLLEDSAPGHCSTTARLRIDKALADAEVYHLAETVCTELRITDGGDLVLHDSPTGHDWSSEPIDVDTDRKLIRLGPWRDEQSAITYRFTLASPACDDGSDCACPLLERHANDEKTTLDLGRKCD